MFKSADLSTSHWSKVDFGRELKSHVKCYNFAKGQIVRGFVFSKANSYKVQILAGL